MVVQHRMENQRGNIGSHLRSGTDRNGNPWANFTLISDVRRPNEQGQWAKVGTEMYGVSVFGAQARNVAESLRPGDPVVVSGDVHTETRVVDGEAMMRMDVRADVVAPDLRLVAVTMPEKSPRAAAAREAAPAPMTGVESDWGPLAEPGSGTVPKVGV